LGVKKTKLNWGVKLVLTPIAGGINVEFSERRGIKDSEKKSESVRE
jgi:hypothetical protein